MEYKDFNFDLNFDFFINFDRNKVKVTHYERMIFVC